MENRELDKWLAENVMGWITRCDLEGHFWNPNLFPHSPSIEFNPTTSISDAFQVVEKMYENDFWFSCTYKQEHGISSGKEGYFSKFRCVRGATRGEHEGYSKKLPESISLAAKKAIEGKGE